jgi:hypothetical protein
MRVVLVKLLQRFRFELPKDDAAVSRLPVFSLTLNAPHEMKIVPVLA